MPYAASGDYLELLGNLAHGLLAGTPEVLALFEPLPLAGEPPRWVRLLRYRYSYAPLPERCHGVWWRRELIDTFVPPTRLRDGQLCVTK